jgi:hypothetical protein
MPVTEQYTPRDYTGDGANQVFSVPNLWFEQSNVIVEVAEVVTAWTREAGVGVRLATAPASGASVIIYRVTSLTQDKDFQTAGRMPATEVAEGFDRQILINQEVKYNSSILPPNSTPSNRQNTTTGFDASGDPITRTATEEIAHLGVTANVEAAATSATAAAASATAAGNSATQAQSSSVSSYNSSNSAAASVSLAANHANAAEQHKITAGNQANYATTQAGYAATSATTAQNAAAQIVSHDIIFKTGTNSGTVSHTLPTVSSAVGGDGIPHKFTIIDVDGNAGTNSLTLAIPSGDLSSGVRIYRPTDGQAIGLTISEDYGVVELTTDGSQWYQLT